MADPYPPPPAGEGPDTSTPAPCVRVSRCAPQLGGAPEADGSEGRSLAAGARRGHREGGGREGGMPRCLRGSGMLGATAQVKLAAEGTAANPVLGRRDESLGTSEGWIPPYPRLSCVSASWI